MQIFILILVVTILLSIVNLLLAIKAGERDNRGDLLTLIYDMCNAHKQAQPALSKSNSATMRNIFFEITPRE